MLVARETACLPAPGSSTAGGLHHRAILTLVGIWLGLETFLVVPTGGRYQTYIAQHPTMHMTPNPKLIWLHKAMNKVEISTQGS